MDLWIVHLLNGFTWGCVLFLIAAGFSIVFGVMGIVNMAHGTLYMIGAYVGIAAARGLGNFWLSVLVGAITAGLIGLVTERVFLRRLHRQPMEQVLLTFGIVYISVNAVLWIWGAWPMIGDAPALLSGSISIGNITFPVYRFAIILAGLMIATGLWLIQDKTRVGAIVRAGMDDKEMTISLGIKYGLIASAVFFLGACIAGFAGAIATPMVGAFVGSAYDMLILALIVVVVGGIGSVQGALIGALIIGLLDTLGKVFFPDIAMFTVYLILVIMLLFRPFGILGRKQI